ncbi:hypothetical protein LB506_012579 [Fusarium annulatum]|nr:hypothetical protein LB506_012579 [Fusarium annulatum]
MSTEGLFKPVPGVEPTTGGAYLWRYSPSVPAAAIFLVLFMASFLCISWKIWKTLEMVGYGVRAGAHSKTSKIMPYAVQNMFILIAPALFAASIYMLLGRIIRGLNADKHSLLKPKKLTRTFVLGDVLSFMIQGGGAGMSVVQNASLSKWAERIVILGLVVQIVIFGLFCAVSLVFHRRMIREPTAESIGTIMPWESTLYMLYAVSLLIMIRSIFRIIEYAQGYTGYSLSHEWTLYIFDTLLMWLVTVIYIWRLPNGLNANAGHVRCDSTLLQEVHHNK